MSTSLPKDYDKIILDKVASIRDMIDSADVTVSTTQTGDVVRRVVTFSYLTHNMDARIL